MKQAITRWKIPHDLTDIRWKFELMTIAFSALILIATTESYAATKTSQSPSQTAYFVDCEYSPILSICVPLVYTWQALISMKYDSYYDSNRRSYIVTLLQEDQSVSMLNARNSPCDIGLGISTDVYADHGQRRQDSLVSTSEQQVGGIPPSAIGLIVSG